MTLENSPKNIGEKKSGFFRHRSNRITSYNRAYDNIAAASSRSSQAQRSSIIANSQLKNSMNNNAQPNGKVISYDENNLLMARKQHNHQKEVSCYSSRRLLNSRNSGILHNNETRKNHHSRVIVPRLNIGGASLKRPSTQGRNANNAAASQVVFQSINEQFNLKLIQHGPDNGVPQDEIPTPTRSSLRSSQNLIVGPIQSNFGRKI